MHPGTSKTFFDMKEAIKVNSEATLQIGLGLLYIFVFYSQVDFQLPSTLKLQLNMLIVKYKWF